MRALKNSIGPERLGILIRREPKPRSMIPRQGLYPIRDNRHLKRFRRMFQKLSRFQTFHMLRGNHHDKARWTLWGVHPIFEFKQRADNYMGLAAR
jgi:hypothetical protein